MLTQKQRLEKKMLTQKQRLEKKMLTQKQRLWALIHMLFDEGFTLQNGWGSEVHIWYDGFEYILTPNTKPTEKLTRKEVLWWCYRGAVCPEIVI